MKRLRAVLVALLAVAGAWLTAAAQGQLGWDGCLNNDGSQSCGDLPGAPLADPTGGPAPSPGSTPRPAFGASTKVTVKLAAGRIGARGPVRVLVSNANAFAVTGTLAGTARIGAKRGGGLKLTAKRFTVAATGRTTIKLALSKALRRELQRKRKLVLRLSAAVQDPSGNRRTVRHEVTPRLKARQRA